MLKLWTDMKGHAKFKDWDTPEKLDRLCAGIATQPMGDMKDLSKMGAVRMSRNEFLEYLSSRNTTRGYHVRM
eukprot:10493796-Heterocapsa_arctica.AAC.1